MMMRVGLGHFLALSLLLHAGAFLAWSAASPALAPQPAGTPLHLALEPARDRGNQGAPGESPPAVAVPPKAVEGPHPPFEAEARERTEGTEAVRPLRSFEHPAEPVVVAALSKGAEGAEGVRPFERFEHPAGGAASRVSAEPLGLSPDQLAARLREAAETHFHYPPLARRRGWEGEVRLALRVEGDGRLSAIRVVASSGHRVLDRAAVDTLMRLARLTGIEGLPAMGMETVLPVRYRLLDAG